ncbi:MAG: NAD(P)/FAD-dependent oxidoreductase [Verrucomicrobia bacterium]|nr:NAD(P)/FAD-dependent oxidoreductase [Verrucomicrobiota bacterium]
MNNSWDAIIIGGGHNGLVTAAYLARGGLRVLVLERRPVLGGACVTEEAFPGFKVSTAAYLCSLMHERIIRELDLPRHGYFVYAKDPAFFTPLPDGRHMTMWQDQSKTCDEIAKFSKKDAGIYPRYEEHIERLSQFADELMLVTPPNILKPGARDLWQFAKLGYGILRANPDARVGLLKLFSQSAANFLEPWFESEELKVTLATDGVIGTYGGPRTPGTAYILLHHVMGKVEGHRGLWGFVRGGMGAVSEAIAKSAQAAGAVIRTEADVKRILSHNGKATGVALANGDEIQGRMIISNADPKRTFLGLLDERQLDSEFLRQIKNIKTNGCSMKINLALDGLPSFKALPGSNLMPHHKTTIHICPNIDYVERAWNECKEGRPSERPMLEITIPTTYDNTLAPPGKHLMGIFLQYTPYHLREGTWPKLKESYADHVLDLIEEYAPGFKNLVLARQVVSPYDMEQVYGLTGGNIFHGDMSLDQLFSLRPVPGWAEHRTPIDGLYLCGSGTHPGGGVMGVPGYNAARVILSDRRS